MNNSWNRKIGDIVEAIHHANGECVFLIGAGCSKSAGIPLAGELIQQIKTNFPHAYNRVPATENNDYNKVMSQLSTGQRTQLLNSYIDTAKINWGHLALAQLFKKNKINRILTVNFDPLIVRACALVGCFPAIYDLATAHEFNENRIAPNSIFYLNGQHTGFTTLNAEDELNNHRDRLRDIVRNTGTNRVWVIIGYSGAADPLLKILAENKNFDLGLYWIGRSEQPSQIVREQLLECKNKDAFYVGNQDSDTFLTELAQKLDCFPPQLLENPSDHMMTLMDYINFSTGGDMGNWYKQRIDEELPLASQLINEKNKIKTDLAKTKYKNGLRTLLLAGKNEEVLRSYSEITEKQETPPPELQAAAAWAYINLGISTQKEGDNLAANAPNAAILKWQQSGEQYKAALQISPKQDRAYYNWGVALSSEAVALAPTNPEAACDKWHLANEKYKQALEITSNRHDALYNWGCSLLREAEILASKNQTLALSLLQEAKEKFNLSLESKPNQYEVLSNFGEALSQEAKLLAANDLPAAFTNWKLAGEKFQQALLCKPNQHQPLCGWAVALTHEGDALASNDPDLAIYKWQMAGEKYQQALEINPNLVDALVNWGNILSSEAIVMSHRDLTAALQKWLLAGKKYERAIELNPEQDDTLFSWGFSLSCEAEMLAPTDLTDASSKWQLANEKFQKSFAINPNQLEVLERWAHNLDSEANILAATGTQYGAVISKRKQAQEIRHYSHALR